MSFLTEVRFTALTGGRLTMSLLVHIDFLEGIRNNTTSNLKSTLAECISVEHIMHFNFELCMPFYVDV